MILESINVYCDIQVVIASATRTPVGCFNGSLKKLTAPELGAIAAAGAIEKAGLKPEQIEEVYIGNVLQANLGQSPARQVALKAEVKDPVNMWKRALKYVQESSKNYDVVTLELPLKQIRVYG
ncbi:43310_t:CDS:2 [Gigaspora margarita]|uniref:43310_t:CDS:1 n=1 Tax=Gigaspora margarita TaxID=4874 RepID=A0ABN7V4M6_GIGMA|nr:43310_t:CDS:2 [Gigaspora margarita]